MMFINDFKFLVNIRYRLRARLSLHLAATRITHARSCVW